MAIAHEKRRALARAYREQKNVGGIYRIHCDANGKQWLFANSNLKGAQNFFDFSKRNGGCPTHELAADWQAHGPSAFHLQVLEALERKEDQSPAAFAEDLQFLLEQWQSSCSC